MKIDIDTLVDFYLELEQYLYSWTCTNKGRYYPVDHQYWSKNFKAWYTVNFNKDIIKQYKKDYFSGAFTTPTYCIGLAENYRKELYERHCKIVKDFEEKYSKSI